MTHLWLKFGFQPPLCVQRQRKNTFNHPSSMSRPLRPITVLRACKQRLRGVLSHCSQFPLCSCVPHYSYGRQCATVYLHSDTLTAPLYFLPFSPPPRVFKINGLTGWKWGRIYTRRGLRLILEILERFCTHVLLIKTDMLRFICRLL